MSGILVFGETIDGKPQAITAEMLAVAREMNGGLGEEVAVAFLGGDLDGASDEAIAQGADKVYLVQDPLLAEPQLDTQVAAFELTATVTDAPANVEYKWFFEGAKPPYAETTSPSAQFSVKLASEYEVSVSMYEAGTEKYLAGDKAVIEARPGEDLIWNRYYSPSDPDYLIEEYQMRRDGTQHGAYRKFHTNGQVANEAEYKDGQEMWFKHYNVKGVLTSEGYFDDDHKRTGTWITYADNGAKKEVRTQSANQLHGPYEKYYGDTGMPETIGRYDMGMPDGEWRAYYPPGEDGKQILKVEYEVSRNILSGPRKEYNRQGILTREVPYANNAREGTLRRWDDEGRLYVEEEYVNDVLVVRRRYNAAGEVTSEERP